MRQSSSTRLFALLGDPVAHSLSPRFQNAGFVAAGLDAVYVALRCSPEDLPALIATLTANGGGGNITIPHKHPAATIPGARGSRVEEIGVANTFGLGEDGLTFRNTDVDGVLASLDALNAPNTAWYLLGTGGSARAVVAAARERGAKLAIRSRVESREMEFADWVRGFGVAIAHPDECEVVVNATPLGLAAADASPLDVAQYPHLQAALDLTYVANGITPWVAECLRRGLRAMDGRRMLVAQGAASWDLWFPGVTPPLEVMRAALDGLLD